MLTTSELKTPIQGYVLLATGRYPGGQLSIHACNPALTVGSELTRQVDSNEEPNPHEAIFKENAPCIPQLVEEGVIAPKPLRQFSQKGTKFVAYQHVKPLN